MNTLRLRAEHSAQKFYNKRQNEPLEALAGDGAGNVDVTGRLNWIWVRVDGNAEAVTVAFNKSGHEFTEDDSIQIRWVKRTGLGYYEVTGYSGSALYDNPSDTTQTTVRAHAAQHQRRDQGQGGFDPLDIYARMVVPLRARPQTVPNLTLHVEAGYNPLTGNYYAGGDSAAFSAPTGLAQAKIDLLYLGSDDALHIVAGTPVVGGSPTLPALVVPSVPLAFVYLSTGQTTITESNIYRDPGILRAPVGAVSSAGHDILSATHTDSDAGDTPVEGDALIRRSGAWTAEAGVAIDSDLADIPAVNLTEQGSKPAAPGAGHRLLYALANGIYEEDSSAVETDLRDARKLQGRTLASTAPTDTQVIAWNNGASQWEPATQSGGHTIQEEGVSLTQRATLNFVGSGVTATDVSSKSQVYVPRWEPLTDGDTVAPELIFEADGDVILCEEG